MIKTKVVFWVFFQTILFALTPADDFYNSFLQKHRPLGTRWKVLSRYKVNKQPKRLQESLGDARNFVTEDYSLWYGCTTDHEDVQTLPSETQKRRNQQKRRAPRQRNSPKPQENNPHEFDAHPQPSSGAASQITGVALPFAPLRGGRRLRRSTITVVKRTTWRIRSPDTCYHEKVRFQVALSLTSIWRRAPQQPLSRAQGKA